MDSFDQACHSGEINVSLECHEISREDIQGDLGEVLLKKKKGRHSRNDITVFDSTGLSVQDVAVGAWIYQKALDAGKGQMLEI